MADAWGGSWGVSWGVSWGSGAPPPPPPPPAIITSTPGFVRRFGLPGQVKGEDEEAKRQRRIRQGTLPPEQRINDRLALESTTNYVKKSANLARALKRLQGERTALLARIAELEAIQTAKAERELLRQRQALQFAALQEALILEQMEVIDIAYCAATILILQ